MEDMTHLQHILAQKKPIFCLLKNYKKEYQELELTGQ